MQVLDYIIVGFTLFSLILGIIRGFLRPLFDLAGIFVVIYAGGSFAPVLQPLLGKLITDAGTCSVVAMIASMVLVFLVYLLITKLILLIFKKGALGAINRIVGAVFGVIIVYLVVSVLTAFMYNESKMFAGLQSALKPIFDQSWIVKNMFIKNPIGEAIVNSAFQKLIQLFESAIM